VVQEFRSIVFIRLQYSSNHHRACFLCPLGLPLLQTIKAEDASRESLGRDFEQLKTQLTAVTRLANLIDVTDTEIAVRTAALRLRDGNLILGTNAVPFGSNNIVLGGIYY
jgi:hypothetical protein